MRPSNCNCVFLFAITASSIASLERSNDRSMVKRIFPLNEIGYDDATGRELIFVSEAYFRLSEVDALLGDSSKARSELGWSPVYSFNELVEEMVHADS